MDSSVSKSGKVVETPAEPAGVRTGLLRALMRQETEMSDTKEDMMMSERLIAAIANVSGDCAGEIETEDDELFVEILAETVIDANRLTIWGYPEEDAELCRLVRAHGYPAVLAEVAKHVIY